MDEVGKAIIIKLWRRPGGGEGSGNEEEKDT
jgi:hypothetical protein